jgi:hypothetical protein
MDPTTLYRCKGSALFATLCKDELQMPHPLLHERRAQVLGDLVLLDARALTPLTAWDARGVGEEPSAAAGAAAGAAAATGAGDGGGGGGDGADALSR